MRRRRAPPKICWNLQRRGAGQTFNVPPLQFHTRLPVTCSSDSLSRTRAVCRIWGAWTPPAQHCKVQANKKRILCYPHSSATAPLLYRLSEGCRGNHAQRAGAGVISVGSRITRRQGLPSTELGGGGADARGGPSRRGPSASDRSRSSVESGRAVAAVTERQSEGGKHQAPRVDLVVTRLRLLLVGADRQLRCDRADGYSRGIHRTNRRKFLEISPDEPAAMDPAGLVPGIHGP
jgi:hypothetical protein